MKRRLVSLLLALMVCLSLLPETARAKDVASGDCGAELSWTLDETGVLTISGTGSMADYEYAGAPWYGMRESVEIVVVESGVTRVGNYAFDGCSKITSVTLPNSVTSLGNRAFYSCDSLMSFAISASVTRIGDRALSCCRKLTSITVAAENLEFSAIDGDLYDKGGEKLITVPAGKSGAYDVRTGVTEIADHAFHACNYLTSITIPQGVTSVGAYAFAFCIALESITIPVSATSIGQSAYYRCDRLADIIYNGTKAQWSAISNGETPNVTVHLLDGTVTGFSATSEVLLNGNWDGVREMETNLGDLVADAMLWYALSKSADQLTVDAVHTVALTNGGGLRTSIAAGTVSAQIIDEVMPFGNTVSIVNIGGAQLLEILEAATQRLPINAFPQTAGIQWTLDTTHNYDPEDEPYPNSNYCGPKSINRVSIQNVNGAAFDVSGTYAVVTNDFLATGGDSYYVLSTAAYSANTDVPMTSAVQSYISEALNGTITSVMYGSPANRLTIIEADERIAVTDVTLNKSTLSLTAGDSETLTATVTPADATNKSVIWSSSDASVATVDASGKVTAVGAGTATITATTADGGKTASCAVTVAAAVAETYTVTWMDADGTIYETDYNVPVGTMPTYNGAQPVKNGAVFTGWSPSIAPVTGNVTYTAVFAYAGGGSGGTGEDDPLISVSTVKGTPGKTVAVSITVKNNPGLTALQLKVDYDNDVLTLAELADEDLLVGKTHGKNLAKLPYTLDWNDDTATSNNVANGELITLYFTIADGAEEGDYPIFVTLAECWNVDMEEVPFAVQSGSVTVTHVIPGDVNGDGIVDGRDRMTLARYLADWDGYAIDELAADVNEDGVVDGRDRMILARHLADWDGYETLPYHPN